MTVAQALKHHSQLALPSGVQRDKERSELTERDVKKIILNRRKGITSVLCSFFLLRPLNQANRESLLSHRIRHAAMVNAHFRKNKQQSLLVVVSCVLNVRGDRAYPLGCSQQPLSYYNYDSYPFPPPGVSIRSTDDYLLLRRLGAGKFSDVFEAVDVDLERKMVPEKDKDQVDPRTLVVLKVLHDSIDSCLLIQIDENLTPTLNLNKVSQTRFGAKDSTRVAGTLACFSLTQSCSIAWCRGAKVTALVFHSHNSPAYAKSCIVARR